MGAQRTRAQRERSASRLADQLVVRLRPCLVAASHAAPAAPATSQVENMEVLREDARRLYR